MSHAFYLFVKIETKKYGMDQIDKARGENDLDPEEVVILDEKADDGEEIKDKMINQKEMVENSTESSSSSVNLNSVDTTARPTVEPTLPKSGYLGELREQLVSNKKI